MKNMVCTATGIVGSVIASLFGGWNAGLTTLLLFMGADYVTGLIVAGVFHNSRKTKNGRLESNASWKGLCRKFMVLILVFVAHRLDMVLGSTYISIRDAVTIAFISSESISIAENAGLMGTKLPAPLIQAIDVLTQRSEEVTGNKMSKKDLKTYNIDEKEI